MIFEQLRLKEEYLKMKRIMIAYESPQQDCSAHIRTEKREQRPLCSNTATEAQCRDDHRPSGTQE